MAPASLVEVFDRLAEEQPARPAVCGSCGRDGADSLSWAELRTSSAALAAQLAAELDADSQPAKLVGILAKRSPLWLAATVAVLRCGRPFVWLGGGELPGKKRKVEAERNAEVLRLLRPGALIVGEDAAEEVIPDLTVVAVRPRLLRLASGPPPRISAAEPGADAAQQLPLRPEAALAGGALCYMLTGGTTGSSKCVEVGHSMALHEVSAYPRAVPMLGHEDRVLQHTPVLWAASALGQVDIALAFGACLCVRGGLDQEAVQGSGATVLGVVPSALEVLDPEAVPGLRCIFTWGEALSPVLAKRWRGAGTSVLELLISTEYWLSFMSDGEKSATGRTVYRAVDGVDFAVLPAGEEVAVSSLGASGELCLRGPMVTSGYVVGNEEAGASSSSSFVPAACGGAKFFRTRDLVRLAAGGSRGALRIEFLGRSDSLVKVAGQFVDLAAAEGRLREAIVEAGEGPEVQAEVAIVPAPVDVAAAPTGAGSGTAAHAFVSAAVAGAGGAAEALTRARAAMPRGAVLHLLAGPLPRDAVTGKVDRKALLASLVGTKPSLPAGPALKKALGVYPPWLLVTALAGCVDVPTLVNVLLAGAAPRRPSAALGLQVLLHIVSVPYLWLMSMYLPRPLQRRVMSYVPFGRLGFLCLLHHLARRVGPSGRAGVARAARAAILAGALAGAGLAWRRGRLLPWWFAFWIAAPGHIESECDWWLKSGGWHWYADQACLTIQSAPSFCLSFGDWVLELLLSLPSRGQELLREFIKARRPYRLPSALMELPDLEAVAATPQVVTAERSGAKANPESEQRGAPAPVAPTVAAEAGAAAPPPVARIEWEGIWRECTADPPEVDSADRAGGPPEPAAPAPAAAVAAGVATTEVEVATASSAAAPGAPAATTAVAGVATGAQPLPPVAVAEGSSQEVGLVAPIAEAATVGHAAPVAAGEVAAGAVAAGPPWRCCQCGRELDQGSEWRCEDGAYFDKPCLKDYDNDWWEFQSKDIIDVAPGWEAGVGTEAAVGGGRPPGASAGAVVAPQPASVAGKRLLELLVPLLGSSELDVARSLAGVDSLAVLTLCRTLRLAVPGLMLRPQDVFKCATVGELLAEVDAAASRVPAAAATAASPSASSTAMKDALAGKRRERAVFFAPPQYTGTCKWLYGCRGLLDETAFRIAAAHLIARHEGLHAEAADGQGPGLEILRFLKDAVALHCTLWQVFDKSAAATGTARGSLASAARGLAGGVRGLASWSLKGSWPRSATVPITEDFLDQRVRVFRCRSWAEVDDASCRFLDEFTPPFVMALYLLEGGGPSYLGAFDRVQRGGAFGQQGQPHEWGAPSSFVHFVVTHAYSDGYSSIPLIHDFGALYARAAAAVAASKPGRSGAAASTLAGVEAATAAASALAPLPYGASFDMLEDRFFAAIEGRPHWSSPDQLSLRPTGFDTVWAPKWPPWCYNHTVLLEAGALASLQRCARRYGMPFDVALLSVVLAAMFRASAAMASWRRSSDRDASPVEDVAGGQPSRSLPLTVYAPMRDSDLNEAMVGLFSDWRDVVIPCSASTTLLGLCLDVADTIRHRRWSVFDPIQNSETILVNILPLDEQERGPKQFRQTRAHEYGNRRGAPSRERRTWKGPHRPMRLTLEQEAPDAWWLSLDINADHYPTAWCRAFVRRLRCCLEDMAQRPLAPVFEPRQQPAGSAAA